MCVGIRFPGRSKKTAELAVGITDVGGIEVPVDVEIGDTAMPASPHEVSEFTKRWKVTRRVQVDAVRKR
jgi:hypothetical protein